MPNDGFYSTKGWHKLRAKTMAVWRASGKPCHFCNQPFNWGAKHEVIVDHVLNRRQYPDRALDPSNLVCTHHGCNTRKAAWVEHSDKPAIGLDGLPDSWR